MASAARTAGLMILRRIVLETGLFSGFLSGSSFGLLGGLLGLLFSTPLGSRLMAVIVPIRRVIVVGRHISRTAITARYTFLDSPSGAEERSRAPIFVEIFFRLHVANEFVRPVEAILLSSCRLEVKALCVATAIPLGFGSQEWLQLTRILDIPTKQHGMIFMLRVMAMLHVSTPEFSETQGNRQITTTIIHPTHSVDILATPLLPIRRRLSVAPEDSAFFEVNMDVMTPATSAIHDMPDFEITQPGCGGCTMHIGIQHLTAVCFDAPWQISNDWKSFVLMEVHRFAVYLIDEGIGRNRNSAGGRTIRALSFGDGLRLTIRGTAPAKNEGAMMSVLQLLSGDPGHRNHRELSFSGPIGIAFDV